MPAIHQLVAGFTRGDAISNEAVAMRAIFRSWGFESRIFSEPRHIHPDLRHEASDVRQCVLECRPDDIALLHLSIGTTVNEVFATLPCRRAILYHNVTPPHFFQVVQPKIAFDLAKGLKQVRALAGAAEVNMADSRFNATEIEALGYRDVRVLPLILNRTDLNAPPDRRVLRQMRDGKTNVIFVGRCAPNKRIEDALAAFSIFQKSVMPESRFIHIGSYSGTERYQRLLVSVSRDLRIRNVLFAGAVPQAELNAYYRSAHIFLCMSEHEGFCIPLLESMWNGVPVVAYAAAAVPETLDGAGCLVRRKEYPMIAELMGRLVRDPALRSSVIEHQRLRVRRHMDRDLAGELRAHLDPLLKPPATTERPR